MSNLSFDSKSGNGVRCRDAPCDYLGLKGEGGRTRKTKFQVFLPDTCFNQPAA